MSTRPARPNHAAAPQHRAGDGRGNLLRIAMCVVAAIILLVPGTQWLLHLLDEHPGTGPASAPARRGGSPPAPMPSAAPSTPSVPADFAAAFQQLSDGIGAQIGLAYAPVDNPRQVSALGTWSSGPAWSTIKVPLSLALLRQDDSRGVTGAMRSAITASDNAAAEEIWQELGAHQTAASKVRSVLADAGQPVPHVQSEVTRAGFSAFGQTRWSLADQARFLAYAACDPRSPTLGVSARRLAVQ